MNHGDEDTSRVTMHSKFRIIKQGSYTQEAQELGSRTTLDIKYDLGIGGGASVILIESDKRILVDCQATRKSVPVYDTKSVPPLVLRSSSLDDFWVMQ